MPEEKQEQKKQLVAAFFVEAVRLDGAWLSSIDVSSEAHKHVQIEPEAGGFSMRGKKGDRRMVVPWSNVKWVEYGQR